MKQPVITRLLVGLCVAFCVGCQPTAQSTNGHQDTEKAVLPRPVATLQGIMRQVIDPNVDPIWNAVTTTVTQAGVEEKAPQNQAEWDALAQHATMLIEAANLLLIPNRVVADPGASTSIHPVELDPNAIAGLIAKHPDDFGQKALALQTAAQTALGAIQAQDTEGLLKAGEGIERACEACHAAYWYPNDKRPLTQQRLRQESLGLADAGYFRRFVSKGTPPDSHAS